MKKNLILCALAVVLSCFTSCINDENCEDCDLPKPTLIDQSFQGLWVVDHGIDPQGESVNITSHNGEKSALSITANHLRLGTLKDGVFTEDPSDLQFELGKITATRIESLPIEIRGRVMRRVYTISEEDPNVLLDRVYVNGDQLEITILLNRVEGGTIK